MYDFVIKSTEILEWGQQEILYIIAYSNSKLTYNLEKKFSLTAWNYTDIVYVLSFEVSF